MAHHMIVDWLAKPNSITVGFCQSLQLLISHLNKIKWKNDTANTISDDYLPI